MSFEARNALMLAKKIADKAAKHKKEITKARGGDVMHTRKVPKPHTPVVGEKEHKSRHPAMMIPGIHVIGAIHGIPTFTGKK